MELTPFVPRRRQPARRQLRVEALEDRLTPSSLGPVEIDGRATTSVLGPPALTAPAAAAATPPPDLVILQKVTDGFPDVIHPGDIASFTITVTNDFGAGDAFNVLGTDQLPAADQLTWVVAFSTFDVTSLDANDFLTFSSSRLASGATESVTVRALIPSDLFGDSPGGTASLPGGPFELDGNAAAGVPGSPAASHDWDQVFLDVAHRTGTSGAIAGSFVTDAVKSSRDDVFTGRSRDTGGIQAGPWRFQDAKPPASNDIAHAFAATYVDPANGNVLLFAGLDRYDSGGAGTGFWFFHDPIGENPRVTTGGGHPFTGEHADGDILLVSDFTAGGSASAMKVFRWTGDDRAGTLVPLSASAGTAFAIANGAAITVPWSFTDKSHNSRPAAGEFLEVGVDLSALGLGGCFSSFLAETRSSQSPTATPSDFVIGTFNSCRLELPNTGTVRADGIDPIDSNFALIAVVPEDAAPQARLERSAPVPVTPADPMTGGNFPPRLTDVLIGVVPPAGHSRWRPLTSDTPSAVTRDEDEPAALRVASVDQVFRMVGEENGLASGKGSDLGEGLLVTADWWQLDREGLTPLSGFPVVG